MIKKTYIPGKPRNPKLGTATGTSGVGKTEFNQVAGSSHEHSNKGVLDRITEAMLVGALRDLITSTDTESELTDENILSALRVLSEISKANIDLLEDIKTKFLSKIEPDTAQKLIKFVEGVEVGDFTTGALGAGAAVKMIDGTSYAEVDNLTVRQKATFRELIIESLKHIGGQLVLTPARMKCVRVVDGGTFYKCYFDNDGGAISNEFVEGDLARCQVFTGSGTKFYWRLVTSVGEDWINISKTSAAVGSDAPEAGDDIAQLGNATDTTRQSAIILSTVGADAPSWKQYSGINSFSLEGKETTVFSKLGNKIEGKTVFTSGGTNLEDVLDGVGSDIQDTQAAANAAALLAQQAIDDAEANVTDYNAKFAEIQAQVDGEISNYSYPYKPTLSNYPASDWTTDIEKDRHIGDIFHNSQAYVDNETTPDAGKAWRFVKNGTAYSWTPIADSDAVKAIQEASKAQAMADGKSTTYLLKPDTPKADGYCYHLGDMWVLNADQTVNGILYKQGELLTATQDSTTFVQAHWLKRIRYTDDTAVNNIEIGGRNLFSNLNTVIGQSGLLGYSKRVDINGFFGAGLNNGYENHVRLSNVIKGNGYYTVSFEMRGEQSLAVGLYVSIAGVRSPMFLTNNLNTYNGRKTYTVEVTNYTANSHVDFHLAYAYFYIKDIQVEKGNKATDWTPAPEDVEAAIDETKLTAEQAQLAADGYMRARYIRDWAKGSSANLTNHWNEIKIINKAGTNLATGKIPTSNGEIVNPANLTDNILDNFTHIPTPTTPTSQYIQIDLGQVHYDIDYIHVWHYYLDGRTYNGTKTEISEDGVNWTTIFDSAVEGTYAETAEGKIHTQRYASVVSKLNKAKATTDLFSGFNGGLATAVIMEMREPSTTTRGDATAGISGIQGAAKDEPAIWAGGTYDQAIAGTAKAIIRHDGSSKFTDADITGVINALSGEIGHFAIVDGKLTANYSYMTYLPGGAYVQVTSDIQITSGGIIISNSYGGTMDHPSIVEWNVEITSAGVKVGNYEIKRDGFYEFGNKIEMGAGDYVHPSTHPASMITGGTFQGIVKANNNTSYTTKQVRNIILSTGDAVSSQMANGDIWIKYE